MRLTTKLDSSPLHLLEAELSQPQIKTSIMVSLTEEGKKFYGTLGWIFEITQLAGKSCTWISCSRSSELEGCDEKGMMSHETPRKPRFLGTIFEEADDQPTYDGVRTSAKSDKSVTGDQDRAVFEFIWFNIILGGDVDMFDVDALNNTRFRYIEWHQGVTDKFKRGPRKRPRGRRQG